MERLLLIFLIFAACQKCPKRVPPFTWHPFLSDELIFSRGKMRKRPLYKAKVPIGWKRDLSAPSITFQGPDAIKIQVIRCGLEKEALSETCQEGDVFTTSFSQKMGEETLHKTWLFRPKASILEGLLSSGQNEEEELFFKQMAAQIQIEIWGSETALELHNDEITLFLDSLTFIQGVPGE